MKKLITILALLLPATAKAADTFTTHFNLVKPATGTTNWGLKLNADFDIIDSSAAALYNANTFVASNTFTLAVKISTSVNITGPVIGPLTVRDTETVVGNAFSVGGSSFVVTGSSVGIRLSAPQVALEVSNGTSGGFPASSGNVDPNVSMRVRGSNASVAIDMGVDGAVTGNTWIQSRNQSNFAANQKLALNPNGGNVGINNNNPANLLSISSGAIQLGGSGALIIFPDGTTQNTAAVAGSGDMILASTQTVSAQKNFTSGLGLGSGAAPANSQVGQFYIFAKSTDGVTLTTGCYVSLGISGATGASTEFANFTSTTTANQYPAGVLLESCAPGTVCKIGIAGIFNVTVDASCNGLNIITGTSSTRCAASNSSATNVARTGTCLSHAPVGGGKNNILMP